MRIIANDVSGSNLTAGSNPALSAFAEFALVSASKQLTGAILIGKVTLRSCVSQPD